MLIAGVVSAIATGLLFLLRRRRFGTGAEARRFQRALVTGQVPADVDRGHWRQVAHDSIRLSRGVRAAIAVAGLLTVALGVSGAVLASENRLYALLLAATLLVVIVSAGVLTQQNLRRARHLHHTLA